MSANLKKIRELSGHAGPIYSLCEGRKPGMVLTASGDKFVAEWDLKLGVASPFSVKLEEAVFTVSCDMEGQRLFTGSAGGNLHVIDLAAKKELRNLKAHSKGIFSILLLKDQKLILAAGGDGILSVWDYDTLELLRHIKVSEGKLRHLYALEDHLYISCGDGTLRQFDLPWLNELKCVDAHAEGCNVSVKHPFKPLIVTGGKDGHLRFWHTDQLQKMREIPAHNFGIYDILFNPTKEKHDSMAISCSRDKSIKVWDSDTFDVLAKIERPKFPAHTHSVNRLFWKDERTFISVGDDRKIMVWETERRTPDSLP